MSPVAVRTFRTINTSLELNGPTLSITEEPSDVTVVANTGDPTFGSVGMATASFNYDETLGTLRYASRAKQI